jgi:molecular chaperone HscB
MAKEMNQHDQAVLAKCQACNKPMSSPMVCDYCHSLNPGAAEADYFRMLGLPRRFDLSPEKVHEKFLALNRHTHPDFHANESQDAQALSLRMASTINNAYRTLREPAARGEYLLGLMGGESSAEDKSVPEGFLGTMMMLQEEIAEAKTDDDRQELSRLRDVLQTQHDGLIRRLGELFKQAQEAAGSDTKRTQALVEIRKQLNAVSYVKKLLSQTT